MTIIELGGQSSPESSRSISRGSRRGKLLYEQVIELVDQLIVERNLSPGDMLPSQGELAQMAQVSLITVRRGLEELELAGRVRRHQVLRTFLALPEILSDPSRTGQLGGTLSDSGEATRLGSKLLGIERCLPSADVAAALEIEPHHQVWHVRRVRLINGAPCIAEWAIIPVSLAPDLEVVYRGGSLYETLGSNYGLKDDYEDQVLDVISPSAEVRSLLKLAARAKVVRIRGLSHDKRGVPFDCFEQVYSALEFAFAIVGRTERRLYQGGLDRDWSVTAITKEVPKSAPLARTKSRATRTSPRRVIDAP